ncbi:hypothetical protein [Massilia sp. DWR3-1-1]|uniref:hypothetical protein n=1 Tax=Massilia sp. DWR3-1-1 TaxID=2804559 RepID=UPI003CEE795D
MHAKSLVAAALFAAALSPAFAADAAPAAATPAASAAAVSVTAQALNLQNVASVAIPAGRSRAEVHAEAVDFVAHYKTMLEVQLELAKN